VPVGIFVPDAPIEGINKGILLGPTLLELFDLYACGIGLLPGEIAALEHFEQVVNDFPATEFAQLADGQRAV
jgi:hypothetical protein